MSTQNKRKILQNAKLKQHALILEGDKQRLKDLKNRAQNIIDCVGNLEKSIEILKSNL